MTTRRAISATELHRPSFAFANRYRKHFHLPTDWQDDGGATFVHFEGVFHHSTLFLNGKFLMQHECGYTGFDVRLVRPIAATFPSLPLETSYLRRTTHLASASGRKRTSSRCARTPPSDRVTGTRYAPFMYFAP